MVPPAPGARAHDRAEIIPHVAPFRVQGDEAKTQNGREHEPLPARDREDSEHDPDDRRDSDSPHKAAEERAVAAAQSRATDLIGQGRWHGPSRLSHLATAVWLANAPAQLRAVFYQRSITLLAQYLMTGAQPDA